MSMGDTFLKEKITNLNFQEEKKRSLPTAISKNSTGSNCPFVD